MSWPSPIPAPATLTFGNADCEDADGADGVCLGRDSQAGNSRPKKKRRTKTTEVVRRLRVHESGATARWALYFLSP